MNDITNGITDEVRRVLTEPKHMSDVDLVIELRRAADAYNDAFSRAQKECAQLHEEYRKYCSLLYKKGIKIHYDEYPANRQIAVGFYALIKPIKISELKIGDK